MKINIELDDRSIQAAFNRLIAAGRDMSPAMKRIGSRLTTSAKNRFHYKEAPDGTPWAPLSDTTIAKKGFPDILIGESGELGLAIHYRAATDHVLIGSPLKYASTQQFGASKGEFGTTSTGTPIPWGDIPARPFLGVSDEDKVTITEAIQDHIARAWK